MIGKNILLYELALSFKFVIGELLVDSVIVQLVVSRQLNIVIMLYCSMVCAGTYRLWDLHVLLL